jgi:hypothetical protein
MPETNLFRGRITIVATDTLDERLAKLEAAVGRPAPAAPSADALAEEVLRLVAEKARSAPPVESPSGLVPLVQFIPAGDALPPPGATPHTDDGIRGWLFHGLFTEVRLIPRMYFDPRYRLSRIAQIGVPVILTLLVVNYLFFNYSLGFIPAVPQILERLVIILLAVVLYKVLAREASRYRTVLEYLQRYR